MALQTPLLSFNPNIAFIVQSCSPRILLLLHQRKETAIYIFTPYPRQRQRKQTSD